MQWFSRRPIRAGEDWRECFAWVPRRIAEREDGSHLWIWMEPYQERCVEGAYVPMGALFKFERKCRAGHGEILISTDG